MTTYQWTSEGMVPDDWTQPAGSVSADYVKVCDVQDHIAELEDALRTSRMQIEEGKLAFDAVIEGLEKLLSQRNT